MDAGALLEAGVFGQPGAVPNLRSLGGDGVRHGIDPRFHNIELDLGGLEADVLDVGGSAGRDEQDLSDDLREALKRFLDNGMDVIVVDQTTPEHRVGGFSCVKVLVPGSMPMTFGYHHRRTVGLPRLGSVPTLLGHRREPLAHKELNQHPHPFP